MNTKATSCITARRKYCGSRICRRWTTCLSGMITRAGTKTSLSRLLPCLTEADASLANRASRGDLPGRSSGAITWLLVRWAHRAAEGPTTWATGRSSAASARRCSKRQTCTRAFITCSGSCAQSWAIRLSSVRRTTSSRISTSIRRTWSSKSEPWKSLCKTLTWASQTSLRESSKGSGSRSTRSRAGSGGTCSASASSCPNK
mmetsp:Transcript_11600/g.15719  ORF Transcript_11600/g.15719 Transcript_11600/m.15719 type:complete len:202 (+) Transcript_11600:833-1438(+)